MDEIKEIQLQEKTQTFYQLPEEEWRRFYTIMALSEFHNGRSDEYDEETLLANLCYHFEALNREVSRLVQLHPDSRLLRKTSGFFSTHYGNIRKVVGNLPEFAESK